MNKPNYIMLSGSGRSGTNITKKILAQHSNVATLPFEFRFIIDPGGIVDFYNSFSTTWSPYFSDRKIKDLEAFLQSLSKKKFLNSFFSKIVKIVSKDGKYLSPSKYYGWELDKWFPNYTKHVDVLIQDLLEFSYSGYWPGANSYTFNTNIYFSNFKKREELAVPIGNFISNCVMDLLEKEGKNFFVEDNTWNYLFSKEISEIIPNSKLIHLIRDPRDVISSLMKQRWSPSNIEQTTIWYKSLMSHWFEVKNKLDDDFVYECKFENLINQTEKELHEICKFTNIPFENQMLEVDLNKSNIGRWKKDLSKKDNNLIRSILGDMIEKLGY